MGHKQGGLAASRTFLTHGQNRTKRCADLAQTEGRLGQWWSAGSSLCSATSLEADGGRLLAPGLSRLGSASITCATITNDCCADEISKCLAENCTTLT
eukprot:3006625-Amphidinium_carterae.1